MRHFLCFITIALLTKVASANTAIAQQDGTFRISYDSQTDRIVVANFSGCELTGFSFAASVDVSPKSKFKQKREGITSKTIIGSYLLGPGFRGRDAQFLFVPSMNISQGIAPQGYRIEEIEFYSIDLLGAETAMHDAENTVTQKVTGVTTANWIAEISPENWNSVEASEKAILGDWHFDRASALLTVKECKS